MTLEHLIEKAIIDVKYYQDRLEEAEAKLHAFYTARDMKEAYGTFPKTIPGFGECLDVLNDLKNITK